MRRGAWLVLLLVAACSHGDAEIDRSTMASSTTVAVADNASPASSAVPALPAVTATHSTVATTSTASPATTTTTTIEPWPRTITMAFTGDTLTHSPLWRQAARNAEADPEYLASHDFTPMLAQLEPLLQPVDLAICHLETPIAPEGEAFTTSPIYGVPEQIVEAIATARYDRCSTASNHSADKGTRGVDRTVEVLEANGLAQSGMARTPAEIEPSVFEVRDVAVSHLSYTFSYNGLQFPDDEQWRSATIDAERILEDATRARALGARIVIVSMHWGAEGVTAPTTFQRRVAESITEPGVIDLIVGHHAHVVQPIEQINDTWVMFGLGNILSNLPTGPEWPAASQDGVVVTIEISVPDDGPIDVHPPVVHPTWVDKEAGWIVRLVDDELGRDDISAGQRGRLERSRARTERVLAAFMDS